MDNILIAGIIVLSVLVVGLLVIMFFPRKGK